MSMTTTVQLERSLVSSLKKLRAYPRESYNDLISRLIRVFQAGKSQNQYDEFLHRVQQAKMKELWDNPEDEAWANA